MTEDELVDYDDGVAWIKRADDGGPQVLLGNGFSRAWRNRTFAYTSLLEAAQFPGLSVDKDELFGALGTSDFEEVAERLQSAALVAEVYELADEDYISDVRGDAEIVKAALANAIASTHPASRHELPDDEVRVVRDFLSKFTEIYSTNYDLLTYWATIRNEVGGPMVPTRDGFEYRDATRAGELMWKEYPSQGEQQVFYLHGALHLYDEAGVTRKLKSVDGRLIDQVRANLDDNVFPLIVTEGSEAQKAARIAASPYLASAFARFRRASGGLVVLGLSMSENDGHIMGALESKESRVTRMLIGVHDPSSEDADRLARRARLIQARRAENGGRQLKVRFFDSSALRVWR